MPTEKQTVKQYGRYKGTRQTEQAEMHLTTDKLIDLLCERLELPIETTELEAVNNEAGELTGVLLSYVKVTHRVI